MTKLSQLVRIRELGLPTARFIAVRHEDMEVKTYRDQLSNLRFPVSVRSSYADEDSQEKSHAGAYKTLLNQKKSALDQAITEVFASYPSQQGQSVIVQEMVHAEVSGVLFAFRSAVWKAELVPGLGENLVSGGVKPATVLIPRFYEADRLWAHLVNFWKPFPRTHALGHTRKALIHLSVAASKLLSAYPESEARYGLDIEFAIARGRLYLLQARPITTPDEAEEVLTSANHKEILPPKPSFFMTGLIASCGPQLFNYYRKLDPSLPPRAFIEVSEGMPWINLSALLDTMVAWGLPSDLVCASVGAEDVYQVGMRPWRAIRKIKVFLRVFREQLRIAGRTRRWVRATNWQLLQEMEARRLMWRNNPEVAYQNWFTTLQVIYSDLVGLMQALTGAMSGPLRLMARLGLLQRSGSRSETGEYLLAFQELRAGTLTLDGFLKKFGHRGFYESDLGRKRFWEFDAADWDALFAADPAPPLPPSRPLPEIVDYFLRPFNRLVRTREWLRHQAMRFFFLLREEINEAAKSRFGNEFDFSAFPPEALQEAFEQNDPSSLFALTLEPPSGWNIDTFLSNRDGRRLHVSVLENVKSQPIGRNGIGIFPGKVRGQIWRVDEALPASLAKPGFESTILLTDSLDPGWAPFFLQVNGVISHVGGLLSHASILLRESRIPSITQAPRSLDLKTGDWVEMDGRTGVIVRITI